MVKEKCYEDVHMNDEETEIATGRSASKRRHSSSHGTDNVSNDEYIKHLQAEIDRLKADSGKASKNQRHNRHQVLKVL